MQTYKIIARIETATGITEETIPALLAGDLENAKQAARMTATPGDTVTYRVVPE